MNKNQKRAIRNLLLVLGTSFALALALIGFFLYHYNPSGLYVAGNTILSPEVAKNIAFKMDSGDRDSYAFNAIEFSYKDSSGHWKRQTMEMDQYRSFYELISHDRSLAQEAVEEASKILDRDQAATLQLTLKSGASSMIFQEVQFTSVGDYYRVNLHEQQGTGQWAYFKHENILSKLQTILKK